MKTRGAGHRRLLGPLLVLVGALALALYGITAAMSADPLWFLGRADVPDPSQIILRVRGQEFHLTAASPDYGPLVDATRKALSAFENVSPLTAGLSKEALREYREQGIALELYFDKPVDFHLPFNDGQPTALLIPIEGRFGGQGYVFRGRAGQWWAGQLVMRDPRPLMDALVTLGYVQP